MPRAALGVMRSSGHSVEHVRDIGLGDATDARIAEHARSAGAVLVTRDLDFADERRYRYTVRRPSPTARRTTSYRRQGQ